MKFVLQIFSILLIMMMFLCQVRSNECVPCPSASGTEFVCAVDDKGTIRKFDSECLLRYENCDKKTKYQITDKKLCD
ncbi:hypothetical protein PVAND_011357 [Polypedilum vanderplanki]|uniref:Kazal-like domain-containing protein n=1 Tax=Polypedilum vanderplanki TaxID=319348 RepID=A0A9J6CIW8_POLVA|nr:hypothetical protein PVAND_011357 [Polypedilum vanderplanki]